MKWLLVIGIFLCVSVFAMASVELTIQKAKVTIQAAKVTITDVVVSSGSFVSKSGQCIGILCGVTYVE